LNRTAASDLVCWSRIFSESLMNGIRAYLLTAPQRQTLHAYPDGALAWNDQGTFSYAGAWSKRPKHSAIIWEDLRHLVITPGFIDVHCHLPQYPSVGVGGHSLLPWLKKFIFPLEREFTPKRAELEAPLFYNELKRNGISSAVVYATNNPKSTDVCFEAAKASGLRITLGQMMMDINCDRARSEKRLTTRTLNESAALCERWHRAENGRLNYAFSPRFVITCSKTLMKESARLAQQSGAFVQSHLAENLQELEMVRQMHPEASDYTQVYEMCGMLGPRSIMGHAIYLSAREYDALASTETKIAHCPSSNLFLRSGVMDYQKMRDWGLHVGLASDVAAGPELSPWEVMKAASYSHQVRSCFVPGSLIPSPVELFYLATAGSAKVVGQSKTLGQLRDGFQADLVAWDPSEIMPYGRDLLGSADPKLVLSRLIYRGAKARLERILVNGCLV
jgi:guanine deaminase